MEYFKNIRNIKTLRERYTTLAKLHHSDIGGNDETMAAINVEYAKVYARIMNKQDDKAVTANNTAPPPSVPGKPSFTDTLKNEVEQNRDAIVDNITDLAGTLISTGLNAVNKFLKKKK